MKAGLVPIINSWTGINIEESLGYEMPEKGNRIDNITQYSEIASNADQQKYESMVSNTLKKSELFSQNSFTASYKQCLNQVLDQ